MAEKGPPAQKRGGRLRQWGEHVEGNEGRRSLGYSRGGSSVRMKGEGHGGRCTEAGGASWG